MILELVPMVGATKSYNTTQLTSPIWTDTGFTSGRIKTQDKVIFQHGTDALWKDFDVDLYLNFHIFNL
jgi:hypothetical protein